jgi:hypothetical protein
MDDTWIREDERPAPARPMRDPGEDAPQAPDPQEGRVERTTDGIPDAAAPLHPEVGEPIGP